MSARDWLTLTSMLTVFGRDWTMTLTTSVSSVRATGGPAFMQEIS